MTGRSRLLTGGSYSPPPSIQPPPIRDPPVNSNFVLILAALLCALISVLGLVTVARCAWIRRISTSSTANSADANKGLKKKVLKSLPSIKFDENKQPDQNKLCECAICLADFAAGEEVRVLPQCGHGFHIECIDMWLASHSSCPSCRQLLICKNCGDLPPATKTTSSGGGHLINGDDDDHFLP